MREKKRLPLNRLVGGPRRGDFLFQEREWSGCMMTSSWRRRGGRRKEKYARTRRDRIERMEPTVNMDLRRREANLLERKSRKEGEGSSSTVSCERVRFML